MLGLGCKNISTLHSKMIMKKLPRSGKMLPLFGLMVESFAYNAEELGLYLTGRRSSGRILNIQEAEWSDLHLKHVLIQDVENKKY